MRFFNRWDGSAIGVLALTLLGIGSAAEAQTSLVITGLQVNGQLSWTGQQAGASYGIQWTDSPGQTWRQGWQDLRGITASNSNGSAQVPVYFRVVRVPTDGLVAHYPFVCDALDSTTNHNDGSISGAVFTVGRTWEKAAYRFDGTNDRIVCGTSALFDLTNTFTLSAWCAPCMGANMPEFNPACMNSCHGSNRSRAEDKGNCETVRDRRKEAVVEVASLRTETSYKAWCPGETAPHVETLNSGHVGK